MQPQNKTKKGSPLLNPNVTLYNDTPLYFPIIGQENLYHLIFYLIFSIKFLKLMLIFTFNYNLLSFT
jgi:hypothetical protein